jgi:hypothetical protein
MLSRTLLTAFLLSLGIACRAQIKPVRLDSSFTFLDTAGGKKSPFDLSIRAANESNWADGVFGPFTYGLIGQYSFPAGMELDATFIRMHEPGMRTFDSFLDEGQLSLRMPLGSTTFAATIWKNRMMDMYTTLGGLEFSHPLAPITIEGGLYAGTASRYEVSGRFLGARLRVAAEFGNLEIGLEHIAGTIQLPGDPTAFGVGLLHHTTLDAALDLAESIKFPLHLTLGVERRYFNFGDSGPVNEPIDTYIIVFGAEVSISEWVGGT